MGTDWDRALGSAGSPPCSGTVSPAVGERSAGMVLSGLFQSWERFSIDVHPAHVYSILPILSPTASTSLFIPYPVTVLLEFIPENQSSEWSRLVGLHCLVHHESLTSQFAKCRCI